MSDELVDLVAAGSAPQEAAARLGFRPRSAHKMLHRRGVRSAHRGNGDGPVALAALLRSGIAPKAAARLLGYSDSGLYKVLHRAGVKLRGGKE